MRLGMVWTVLEKDLRTFLTKRFILVSVVLIPLLLAVGLPVLLERLVSRGAPSPVLERLPDAFTFFFMVFATFVPVNIASYSIVGEKLQASLEPLLATPITDAELLVGKLLGGFLPSLAAMVLAEALFGLLLNVLVLPGFTSARFPSSDALLLIVVGVPLAALFGAGTSLLISSRSTDVRASQGLGAMAMLPMILVYLSFELGLLTFDTPTITWILAALAAADAVLLWLDIAAFRREEILTAWT